MHNPSEKWSGEQTRISWAYSKKWEGSMRLRDRYLLRSTSLTTVKCSKHLAANPFNKGMNTRMELNKNFTVAKVCTSPRNLTWLTRPFLLMRGWGLGMRLIQISVLVTLCRHIKICCVQADREGNFAKPLCSFVSQEFA